MESLFEEIVQFSMVCWGRGQNVNLVFSFYQYFERGYNLDWLAIDLDWDDLVV